MAALGSQIRSLRLSIGLNREILAVEAGISSTALGMLERGETSGVTWETVKRIHRALNAQLEAKGETPVDLNGWARLEIA